MQQLYIYIELGNGIYISEFLYVLSFIICVTMCFMCLYQVAWPVNTVITEESINKYNQIFSFMLLQKQTVWVLKDVWHRLKRAGQYNCPWFPPRYLMALSHSTNNLPPVGTTVSLHPNKYSVCSRFESFIKSLHRRTPWNANLWFWFYTVGSKLL